VLRSSAPVLHDESGNILFSGKYSIYGDTESQYYWLFVTGTGIQIMFRYLDTFVVLVIPLTTSLL
jgi:hypothetical protein